MKFSLLLLTTQLLSFSLASPKPDPERVPLFARWLVNQSSWGVLSTLDPDNAPCGNVVSFSTGPAGIPYFFLTTTFDPTGMNAIKNPESSFALSEYPLGSCEVIADPQTPNCSKITLNGKLIAVEERTREDKLARSILFADHPRLNDWPTRPEPVENIFLVNANKPRRNITVAHYLNA